MTAAQTANVPDGRLYTETMQIIVGDYIMNVTLVSLLLAAVLLFGCSVPETGEDNAGFTHITYEQVKSLLSRELTIEELYSVIGQPIAAKTSTETPGRIKYKLPGKHNCILFTFKGNYIVEAVYDGKRIEGVSPTTYQLRISHNGPSRYKCWLNDEAFYSLNDLKRRLAELPQGAVVEYISSCSRWPGYPLQTREQIEDFESFFEKEGLILIWHRSG